MTLVDKALILAYKAHNGQKRKYTGEPYITHPISVVGVLKEYFTLSDITIAAALLHDVLEDTSVTEKELRELVGDQVTDLVIELTDVSRPEDGNREVRKKLDREHTLKCGVTAQAVKLADLIHNARSIKQYDKDFWKVYRKEILCLLDQWEIRYAVLLKVDLLKILEEDKDAKRLTGRDRSSK